MTTNELIEMLTRADPQGTHEVEIPVYAGGKPYPAAYVAPVDVVMGPWDKVRVSCRLPDGMTTMQRKVA